MMGWYLLELQLYIVVMLIVLKIHCSILDGWWLVLCVKLELSIH